MNLSPQIFQHPNDDDFIVLPPDLQSLVLHRLAAMKEIAGSPKTKAACVAIARQWNCVEGWTARTLLNLWYAFRARRDWKVLLDKSRAGALFWQKPPGDMPAEFQRWLGSQWSARQRGKFRAGWVDLKSQYRRWLAGDDSARIPGFHRCPPPRPDTNLPDGWSEGNLRRVAQRNSSAAARKLINIGPKAVQQFTYKVPTTRVGVEVGEVIYIDDCWNDFQCLLLGKRSRIISLHLLDLASGYNAAAGHKPTADDERGVEQRLKERETIYLLDAYFAAHGYRPAGTHILGENATATVRAEEQKVLDQITNGAVRFDGGPSGGGPGLSALFTGPSGGNPNHKAPLESWFNLWHNRCDHMLEFPGQTGKNSRLDKPEGLERLMSADEQLHKAAQWLTPERRMQVKFGLLQHDLAIQMLDTKRETINDRRDHDLKDWRQCGHYTPAFRLSTALPFFPAARILELSPEHQDQLRVLLAADPNLVGELCLSPREVFMAGREKLRRFTPQQRAMFIRGAAGDERPVKQGLIEVSVPEVDASHAVPFGPIFRDFRGGEKPLTNGDKYMVRVNPYDPRHAWLYDAKDGFRGVVQARGPSARYDDATALESHYKAKAVHFAPILAEARQLAAPLTAAASEKQDHNARLFAEQTREETQMDRTLDRRARNSKEDFTALGGETPAPKQAGVTMEQLSQL